MDSQHVEISQSLFIRTAADGTRWEFAGTTTGGCAITRSGEVITTSPGTAEAVAEMLERFLQATAPRTTPDLSIVEGTSRSSSGFAA